MSLSTTPSSVESPSARQSRLEALYGAHGRAVFAYARRRANAADADEVVSETFLVAWRRLDDIPDPALPWLLGVARRSLANLRRGEARRSALRQRLGSVRTTAPIDDIDPSTSSAVRRALDALSPGEREALTLLAWEGLTPDEVATVLGCTRAAVYLRVHRARRRFARTLNVTTETEDLT